MDAKEARRRLDRQILTLARFSNWQLSEIRALGWSEFYRFLAAADEIAKGRE